MQSDVKSKLTRLKLACDTELRISRAIESTCWVKMYVESVQGDARTK